ncbi:19586_t:CDS:2 [Gigaspora margarita]|uniref:19586_t:CDS:1 n=1 Tax=Gigaspora margarita TaxID=4874 RepID=A0ABM8VWK1_GIGMA|nr:19586_t:CDS:2 [Gigaspora margarita]
MNKKQLKQTPESRFNLEIPKGVINSETPESKFNLETHQKSAINSEE